MWFYVLVADDGFIGFIIEMVAVAIEAIFGD